MQIMTFVLQLAPMSGSTIADAGTERRQLFMLMFQLSHVVAFSSKGDGSRFAAKLG